MFRFVLGVAGLCVGAGVLLAPVAAAGPPYANCTAAKADGRSDIPRDDPAYWPGGDRDQDGYACES